MQIRKVKKVEEEESPPLKKEGVLIKENENPKIHNNLLSNDIDTNNSEFEILSTNLPAININATSSNTHSTLQGTGLSKFSTLLNISNLAVFKEGSRERAEGRWRELEKFMDGWYYKFDYQALRIAMCVGIAHESKQSNPVWLFVIAPPASGKTVIIDACGVLRGSRYISSLTSRTLVSGGKGGKGKDSASLLHRIGESGVMLFRDFTTFLSMKIETRQEIAGQLREVYDGHLSREVGMGGGSVSWKGKISIIAAATGEVEHAWSLQRAMGERFVSVRWKRLRDEEAILAAQYAQRQIECKKVLEERIKKELGDLVDYSTLALIPMPRSEDIDKVGILHLSELTVLLRGVVERDNYGKREVIDVPEQEAGTRFSGAIVQIARANASLMRKGEIEWEDYKLASRVARDSIPLNRKSVFENVPDEEGKDVKLSELERMVDLPYNTVKRVCEDLDALRVVEMFKGEEDRNWYVRMRREARELKERARRFYE